MDVDWAQPSVGLSWVRNVHVVVGWDGLGQKISDILRNCGV